MNFVDEYYDAWDKARESSADDQVHQNKIDIKLEQEEERKNEIRSAKEYEERRAQNSPDNPICETCGEPVLYYIENAICGECAGELREADEE